MSQKSPDKKPNPQPNNNNVVSIADNKCTAEGCKSKPARAGFCNEHYVWFKEGLLTIDGYKAKDFEKKYYNYVAKKAA